MSPVSPDAADEAALRDGQPRARSWQQLLELVALEVEPLRGSGKVADYIEALARVDPNKFGLALVDRAGERAAVGDSAEPFSIQSISKVFALTLALCEVGDALWKRVWREPSGTPFNSIVQLEVGQGVPRNPFINAGALVVTDLLISRFGKQGTVDALVELARERAGNPRVEVDEEVARSELRTSHRNAGLAHVIKGFGNLENAVEDVLEVYCRQCAIAMSCADLARSALYLSAGGRDPLDGAQVISPFHARRINAIMMTCGHYDAAGDFACRVGLPGKSGVGGGILAVAPGQLTVVAWSPGINENGNSLVGSIALEAFVRASGLAVL